MTQQVSTGLELTVMFAYFLIFTIPTTAASKVAFSNDEIRDIEKFAGDVMGCSNIPGLALGVVRGDATFSTGLGVGNMGTGHPVDKRTIFNLGSTAKAFVPYIIAEIMNGKENHDGRIGWNTTLKDILQRRDDDIEVPLPWADTMLKDMLVYKSGSSAADMTTMVGLPKDVTREEVIRRLRFLPKTTDFLNSHHYSNIMYTVAGHLAERLSGMSWEELVKNKVFHKQHMKSPSFAPEGMSDENSALPYRFHVSKLGDPFAEQSLSLFNLHPFTPVGSLMVSAEDVTKWLRHLLHNLHSTGNDSGINMFIRDAFHQWVTVSSDHQEGELTHGSETDLGYGMGWYSSNYRDQRRYKFNGGLYAYRSQIWLFPESMAAVFVSINGPGNERALRALEGIMYHISDTTLGKLPWVDTNLTCCCRDTDYDYDDHKDDVAPAEVKLIKYLAPVEKYMGHYGNGLVGDLNIEPNEAGVLILKLGQNLAGELTPDVTESKLKFVVTSSLLNTEEWCHEKTLEFLLLTPHAGSVGNSEPYDKVRIYMKDNLFYEFNRGKRFESLLILAEEDEKRLREESESGIYKEEHKHNKSNEFDTKNNHEDNHPVKDKADNHENNHNVNNLRHGEDVSESGSYENDIISNTNLDTGDNKSKNHQNHQPYSSEDQDDGPNLDNTQDHSKFPETKSDNRNKKALKGDNASSTLQTFCTLTFLMILLNVLSFI